MDRLDAARTEDRSAWFWLVVLLGVAILMEVAAVRRGDMGIAISGIGIAVLGAFAFICPIPLGKPLRIVLRPPATIESKAVILAGVGSALNAIGLAVKWLA